MESFIIYLLKASALLGIFYLSYFLLLKKETSFNLNRKYLLLGIITAGIFPAIYFTKKVYVEASSQPYSFTVNSSEISSVPVETPIDWWQIAGIVYLILTGFFLLRFSLQLISVFRILYSYKTQNISGLKYLKTENDHLPFSFFNYIVYNPKIHSEKDLELILEHEKIHARQLHSADILLVNLVSCILWFNPFAWLYKKSVEQNLEFIADRETVSTNAEIKEYQRALVKVSIADHRPALTNHFYQSFIKKRILMLNKKSSTHSPAWKLSLLMPVLLAFMLLFNVKTEAQEIPQKESEAEVKNEEKSEQGYKVVEVTNDEEPQEVHVVKAKKKNAQDIIGNNPLYVVNGKEYKSSRLEKKFIAINSGVDFMSPAEATQKYGSKGENGVVIIPNGVIFKNFNKRLNEVQKLSTEFKGRYLTVGENGKPRTIEIRSGIDSNEAIIHPRYLVTRKIKGEGFRKKSDHEIIKAQPRNVKVKVTGTGYSTDDPEELKNLTSDHTVAFQSVKINSNHTGSLSNSNNTIEGDQMFIQQSNPLYVLNGEVQKSDFKKDKIDPKSIKKINVLKGTSATDKYGEAASDGVIEIYTKKFEGDTAHPVKTDFYVLHKNSNEENIENLKKMIKSGADIETEFTDIKRNSEGDITAVSIKAKTKDGKMASASFQNSEGIPLVIIGLSKDNKLVVSSNYENY
ncbi:M56 family metallopeptidase [Christiangramia sediminis]|uniref:M56 family metallopeptidase n=1 Tax=Christiangramia sediminis TaxID=2881336 RepID=A0A9X1LJE0_9FLAO|nr:M56 family metallopeptidase [Christiangramia sediminis]MCB7481407.1 M56 family metallopeptidase [Christiangramia sediminis]